MDRHHTGVGTALGVMLLLASIAVSEAPIRDVDRLFQRRDTWSETLIATREAYARDFMARQSFRPVRTDVLRGTDSARRIEADVRHVQELALVATIDGDDYNHDQAVWGKPILIASDGTRVPLSTLEPVSVSVGYHELLLDHNLSHELLQIGSRTFEHGLWAHAPSRLVYRLDGQFERFEAWVGIEASAGGNGSSEFLVLDDTDPLPALWQRFAAEFPQESDRLASLFPEDGFLRWFHADAPTAFIKDQVEARLHDLGTAAGELPDRFASTTAKPSHIWDAELLTLLVDVAERIENLQHARSVVTAIDLDGLRQAVDDMARRYPERFVQRDAFMEALDAWEPRLDDLSEGVAQGDTQSIKAALELADLQRSIMLFNPALGFDEILMIRRGVNSPSLGLPHNWQSNCSLPVMGYDDAIVRLDLSTGHMKTVYAPEEPVFVGDMDLHFDGTRLLFSMSGTNNRWHVHEITTDGSGLRRITPDQYDDIDFYDACYLSDGAILFASTACYLGVPCVSGSDRVATLYRMEPDGETIRQLGFDQDHNWSPAMLNNGRVLYQRWEYTDTPHSNTRLLFHMNPDGTNQMEYYGSNSYWPNSIFYAKPIPEHPTKVVGIVTGHHGARRKGEMILFDPAQGRHEVEGAVHRFLSGGEAIEPVIADNLVDHSWPKFLHPYPIDESLYLAAIKPSPDSLWGIYLVDVFDNSMLVKELPGYALFEPIPLQSREKPPVVASRVQLDQSDATIYMMDVYEGPGLDGIPRGEVTALRVFSYVFGYRNVGALYGVIGADGPWDIRRILGTVPVEPDGSAMFTVPANTPIAVQPLDKDGRALQQMRSWFTAMPGEVLSCVGCHEHQNTVPPTRLTEAAQRPPIEIEPWYGPERSFSFAREVQPVLDRHCIECHDGDMAFDMRAETYLTDWYSIMESNGGPIGGQFTVGYERLQRYVRRPGIESDYHLLTPMDFHAGTTELVQMLEKGHHDVQLDAESWDRIHTWIDFNAPYHGYWSEIVGEETIAPLAERRRLYDRVFAALDIDYETPIEPEVFVEESEVVASPLIPRPSGNDEEGERVASSYELVSAEHENRGMTVDLGNGLSLDLVYIPGGTFNMGSENGDADEKPLTQVTVAPYWMGRFEVTNAQYAQFDPHHDSRVESKHAYQFGVQGFPLNEPDQPVVRVSWSDARAFCDWLSEKTGLDFDLPTEAQWEYAGRAGTVMPLSYGTLDDDFSSYANLADQTLTQFVDNPYAVGSPLSDPSPYDDRIPKDTRFNDGALVSTDVGSYEPNSWGLHDMHGNVSEWTRSLYMAYPYSETDGRNDPESLGRRAVRGGSWYDLPHRARSAFRLGYVPYQRAFNVGFRVVVKAETLEMMEQYSHVSRMN